MKQQLEISGRGLLGVHEVAQRWGVSDFSVRRLIAKGDIASVSVGARRVIPVEEILRIEQSGRRTRESADCAELAPEAERKAKVTRSVRFRAVRGESDKKS